MRVTSPLLLSEGRLLPAGAICEIVPSDIKKRPSPAGKAIAPLLLRSKFSPVERVTNEIFPPDDKKIPGRPLLVSAPKATSPELLIATLLKLVNFPLPIPGASCPSTAIADSAPLENRKIPCRAEPPVSVHRNATSPESLIDGIRKNEENLPPPVPGAVCASK